MGMRLGADTISKMYLGSAPVSKAYLGADLVFGDTPPAVPALTDTFTRHATGALSGKVAETGQTWVTITGGSPDASRASAFVDGSGRVQGNFDRTMSYLDTGSRNGTFTGTVAQDATWQNWPSCSVAARADGDRYFLQISGFNIYLSRVRLGVLSDLQVFGATTSLANGDVIKMGIQQVGPLTNRIKVKQNGLLLGTYDDTDATYVPDGHYSGIGSEQIVGWFNYRFDPAEIL